MSTATNNSRRIQANSPFLLENEALYQNWRTQKLEAFEKALPLRCIEITDPLNICSNEKQALLSSLNSTNTAIYSINKNRPVDKAILKAMATQLGVVDQDNNLCADEDGITSLSVSKSGPNTAYIPYTNKALSWHTDGYYNTKIEQIQAILMHCVTPAATGGENAFLDHELLYLTLRDKDPALIKALMDPEAMGIPANTTGGSEIRAAVTGPVFSVNSEGVLHMRYSARQRNINWRDNAATKDACEQITAFLASDSPYIFRYRLAGNEGVISQNVLHNRTAFEDIENGAAISARRLLYRIRFFKRFSFESDE